MKQDKLISNSISHLEDRALIFMSGKNCANYLERAFLSLKDQSFQNFDILFIDDSSNDSSGTLSLELLKMHFTGRFYHKINLISKGKARNAYENLPSLCEKYVFVAVLDADDSICDDSILEIFSREYSQNFDVIYSNYVTDKGVVGPNEKLNPFISPRGQGWKTSHFFSFRASLFISIPVEYFQQPSGEWITSACDFAIAYPILDQTRRYLFIKRNSYLYNSTNPLSHHNQDGQRMGLNSRNQSQNAAIVLNKKPLICRRFLEDVPGMLELKLGQELSAISEKQEFMLSELGTISKKINLLPLKNRILDDLTNIEELPLNWFVKKNSFVDLGYLNFITQILELNVSSSILDIHSNEMTIFLIKLASNRNIFTLSISNDIDVINATKIQLERLRLNKNVSLQYKKLNLVSLNEKSFNSYDLNDLGLSCDSLVVISNSLYSESPYSRLPILFKLNSVINSIKLFFIYKVINQTEDIEILKIWSANYPNIKFEHLEFENSYILITN